MKVELINCTDNPVQTIDRCASICYDSDWKKSDGKIMKNCIKSGHLSVTEHTSFTFYIDGISRACSHQLVRHRTGKYTQRSQRYIVEDDFGYIVPKSILKNSDVYSAYRSTMNRINWFYSYALRNGIKEEDARYVLPNACETQLYVTFDFRNLMHFMNERLCTNAQWEIRELARRMKDEVVKLYPELADYLVPKCQIHKDYPFCTENKCCGLSPKLKDVYNKD